VWAPGTWLDQVEYFQGFVATRSMTIMGEQFPALLAPFALKHDR
jgi:hypothetical protein